MIFGLFHFVSLQPPPQTKHANILSSTVIATANRHFTSVPYDLTLPVSHILINEEQRQELLGVGVIDGI
jgi:hypothetical protein